MDLAFSLKWHQSKHPAEDTEVLAGNESNCSTALSAADLAANIWAGWESMENIILRCVIFINNLLEAQ